MRICRTQPRKNAPFHFASFSAEKFPFSNISNSRAIKNANPKAAAGKLSFLFIFFKKDNSAPRPRKIYILFLAFPKKGYFGCRLSRNSRFRVFILRTADSARRSCSLSCLHSARCVILSTHSLPQVPEKSISFASRLTFGQPFGQCRKTLLRAEQVLGQTLNGQVLNYKLRNGGIYLCFEK